MSHWFPTLNSTGVPVPDTRIVTTDLPLEDMVCGDAAMAAYPPEWLSFLTQLRAFALEVGWLPIFLRTGHGSGKHDWLDTCYVAQSKRLGRHVAQLVEWSAMRDLPTRVWAVREALQLVSSFTAFNGFPVNCERRYFIENGKVSCHHPYWPQRAVADGSPSVDGWQERLEALNEEASIEVAYLTAQSERVAAAFPGESWSLDWALATDGVWYAIDMAPAELSYHWPGCQKVYR